MKLPGLGVTVVSDRAWDATHPPDAGRKAGTKREREAELLQTFQGKTEKHP